MAKVYGAYCTPSVKIETPSGCTKSPQHKCDTTGKDCWSDSDCGTDGYEALTSPKTCIVKCPSSDECHAGASHICLEYYDCYCGWVIPWWDCAIDVTFQQPYTISLNGC